MSLTGLVPLQLGSMELTHAIVDVQWWGATVSEEHKDAGEAGTSHWDILCATTLCTL